MNFIDKTIILSKRIFGLNITNFLANSIIFKMYEITDSRECSILKDNIKFKNIHEGKRCFILGNGPSLKEHNLKLLEDEYVFTVNQINRSKDFKNIKTNYHFWADPIFFNLDEKNKSDIELLDVIKGINTGNNKPMCFFPIEQYDFIKKYEIDKEINVSYFKSKLEMTENYKSEIDFSKFIPGYHTVVQYAIIMAIYMGFKEIYILGSEFTSILTSINVRLRLNLENDYAYELSEHEQKRMHNRANKISFENELNSFYNVVKDYRVIRQYGENRGIKIYNCTPGGLIESLERRKYEHIINGDKNV